MQTNNRRPFVWTENQIDKLSKVQTVLSQLHEFKPLTLRQVYYQLVGRGYIENNVSQYGMLSKLLKHARIEGFIHWDDIEDRVRSYYDLTGFVHRDYYLKHEFSWFLNDYQRDALQGQDVYPEVWIEKDALSSIFRKVASYYTVPVVVCRGFSSVSFLNTYKERLRRRPHQNPILLYFGDFDPSGVEMLEAMQTTLRDELGVNGIQFKRKALLKDDIFKYRLPHSPDALKHSDTRAKKHIDKYGELAVELDALPPNVLQDMIREGIEAELNMEAFTRQKTLEKTDLNELKKIKEDVAKVLGFRA